MIADRIPSDDRESIFAWAIGVVDTVSRDFQSAHCAVFLHDVDEGVLRLAAVRWGPSEDLGLIRPGEYVIPLESSVTGRVFRTGLPALIPDVALDPDYRHFAGGHNRSELTVPILVDSVHVGVINIESAWSGAFGIADLENLQRHARTAAESYRDQGLEGMPFTRGGDPEAGNAG